MSWCDKLASTPGASVMLNKSFIPIPTLLEPLVSLVSGWVEKDKPAFSVDQQDLFGATLTTMDGYRYSFGYELFAVEFHHRLRFRPQSAGPPTAELISKPLPYTELLSAVTGRLTELLRATTTGTTRKLERIGVKSTTVVSEDEAPPGIHRFLRHVGKPWGEAPQFYNVTTIAKLPKVRGTIDYDRCVHTLIKQEDGEELVTVVLEWQRYLGEDRTLSMAAFSDLIDIAERDALAYFEDIGEGGRFDE